jgi:CBS domain-containing protein
LRGGGPGETCNREKEVSMALTVADVMTANPRFVSRLAAVPEAAKVMQEEDVGSVPVVDDKVLVGIITDRDIAVRVVAAGLDPSCTRVGEVASADLHSATPNESLEDAYIRMTTWRIRRLPVVEDESRLVGMLAQADLVHALKDKKAGQLVDEISQPGEPSFREPSIGVLAAQP